MTQEEKQLKKLQNYYMNDIPNLTEENLVTCHDINGREFKMVGIDIKDVNVLDAGYAITPEGVIIRVTDSPLHADIFSLYINNYYGNPESDKYYDLPVDYIEELNKLGCIVYMGARLGAIAAKENMDASRHVGLSFPKPSEHVLTNKQRLACTNLLLTNVKPNDKTYRGKVMDFDYGFGLDVIYGCGKKKIDDVIAYNRLLVVNRDEDMALSNEDAIYFYDLLKKHLAIQEQRYKNVDNEYHEVMEEYLPLKKMLKKIYDKILTYPISEQTKAFQKFYNEISKLNEPSLYQYLKPNIEDTLILNMDKIELKRLRYEAWIDYLEKHYDLSQSNDKGRK